MKAIILSLALIAGASASAGNWNGEKASDRRRTGTVLKDGWVTKCYSVGNHRENCKRVYVDYVPYDEIDNPFVNEKASDRP
jgi:hypothetical protein